MIKKMFFNINYKNINKGICKLEFPKNSKYYGFFFFVDLKDCEINKSTANSMTVSKDQFEKLECFKENEKIILTFDEIRFELNK